MIARTIEAGALLPCSTRRLPFDGEYGHHVSPAHHLALLNHPEVHERLRGWLEPIETEMAATG